MHATTRKTLRDLRRQRAQVIAVAITIMLGVGLFIATAGAFANLSASYAYTYQRLGMADYTATGGDPQRVAAAARTAGADRVTVRTVFDPPMRIAGTTLIGRVIGLPDTGRPTVDDVDVRAGAYLDPAAPSGVLVERHAADTFGLRIGDQMQIYTAAGWQAVTVRGIVVSPEYLWPARSRQDVLGDPHAFAVVFAAQPAVAQWAATGPNQALATIAGTASARDSARVDAAMRTAGAVDVIAQANQPSNATLGEDLSGFREMSVAFPLLFLTAAAVAAYVLLARRVLAERPIIGTLMAAGARRRRVIGHYLGQGLVVGVIGGLAGIVLGIAATSAVTRGYTAGLGIPDTIIRLRPELWITGLVFASVVGLAAAAAPAITAARTAPAAAMRNQLTTHAPGAWSRWIARRRGLPITTRMALRDVVRSRRRTIATATGSILALILVLATVGMLTSLTDALDVQYTQIEHQDATVTVAAAAGMEPAVAAVPGVAAVEQTLVGQTTAAHDGHTYSTVLNGLNPDTAMHRFRDINGTWITLPTDGILAGASLADKIDAKVGDTITLTSGQTTVPVRLAGLLDEPVGTAIYLDTTTAARLLPQQDTATYLVRFAPGADRAAMRRELTSLPGVLAYADARSVTQSLNQYLGLFWAFITVMIILGVVLAFTVIYVTMAVNVVERTNELATLRTAGVSLRRVAATLATENIAAVMLSLPIGLPLGVLAARGFLATFSSDLFRLDLRLDWWALLAAAIGILTAAAVSQWPATRAIRRLNLARVIRERAT